MTVMRTDRSVDQKGHSVEAGTKHDGGKVMMGLLSPATQWATAEVLTRAVTDGRYGPYNWANGIAYSRVYDALQRHLTMWWMGEEVDSETNQHHLAHASCCIMFLLHYVLHDYTDMDDRFTGRTDAGSNHPARERVVDGAES